MSNISEADGSINKINTPEIMDGSQLDAMSEKSGVAKLTPINNEFYEELTIDVTGWFNSIVSFDEASSSQRNIRQADCWKEL